jgi:colanic acid biosynthesis glycosyl transferase WcaI
MRILILSQWYLPEPDFKIHLLGRNLAQSGHQVTAITGFPNYPGGQLYPGYRIRWRQWEQRDGVRVLRVPLYPDHSWSGLRRILNYLSFALSASSIGAVLCGRADVMWVYHPPLTVGIPAWWISLLRRIPYVFNIHDMWPETLAATGMLPLSISAKWLGAIARFVYRRAAAITVVSPGFRRNLIEKGVPADKIHVIPNWADEDVYRPVPRDEALAAEYGLSEHFNAI